MKQQREPAGALDERADRRAAQAEDQIARPVARNRAVGRFARPLRDQDLVPRHVGPRHAQRASGAQARFLAAQLSSRTRETYAVDLALFLSWLRGRCVHPRDAARPGIDRYRNWLVAFVGADGRPAADGRPRYQRRVTQHALRHHR